jgi:hypothetical protein
MRVLNRSYDAIRESRQAGGSPTQQMKRFAVRFTETVIRNQAGSAVFFREEASIPPEITLEINELKGRFDQEVAGLISDGLAAGEFKVGDARTATLALGGMISWIYIWYRKGGRLSPEAIGEHMAALGIDPELRLVDRGPDPFERLVEIDRLDESLEMLPQHCFVGPVGGVRHDRQAAETEAGAGGRPGLFLIAGGRHEGQRQMGMRPGLQERLLVGQHEPRHDGSLRQQRAADLPAVQMSVQGRPVEDLLGTRDPHWGRAVEFQRPALEIDDQIAPEQAVRRRIDRRQEAVGVLDVLLRADGHRSNHRASGHHT